MSEKRRGLGKGLGALIPTAPVDGRPVDVFFPDQRTARAPGGAGTSDTVATSDPRAAPASASNGATSGIAANGRSQQGGTKSRKRPSIPKDTVTPRRKTAPAGTSASHTAASADVAEESPAGTSGLQAAAPTAGTGERSAVTSPEPAVRADEKPAVASPVPGATSPKPATPGPATDADLLPVPGASFAEVLVDEVVANRRQPRQVFDEDELEELAASIREVGVLQPIVVRPLPAGDEARYELIMGERRWRASQLAGSGTVPAIVRHVDDNDMLRDALLENLHRSQLNPLEEAAAYQQLLEDFACTHEELATRIARSRPQISNTLRLLKLPPLVQRRVAAGILSAGHARSLLGMSDPAAMERLAQRIVAEGLSVRTTEEIVALGDEPTAPEMRRRPRTGAHTAELNQLATRLSDRFDTRVKIGMGQRKGKINIEFASLEDLNRILDVLAPEDRVPVD